METYVGYYNNPMREKCSSGGVFYILAKQILDVGGAVYGVAMSSDKYNAEYVRIVDKHELEKLCGSKYMQADICNAFKEVQRDLSEGLYVLFSGTICQVNGLKSFLGKEYTNLFCVDVICHGVPSQKLWKKYLVNREQEIGKCETLSFRSKDKGWYEYGIKENDIYTPQTDNSYMIFFIKNYCLRPSCYKCIAKRKKASDITIGDFWGIEKKPLEINDNRGLSVIILRTEKGKQFFSLIRENMILKELSFEEGIIDNPAENKSAIQPWQRKDFYKKMNSMSYDTLVQYYFGHAFHRKILRKIAYFRYWMHS